MASFEALVKKYRDKGLDYQDTLKIMKMKVKEDTKKSWTKDHLRKFNAAFYDEEVPHLAPAEPEPIPRLEMVGGTNNENARRFLASAYLLQAWCIDAEQLTPLIKNVGTHLASVQAWLKTQNIDTRNFYAVQKIIASGKMHDEIYDEQIDNAVLEMKELRKAWSANAKLNIDKALLLTLRKLITSIGFIPEENKPETMERAERYLDAVRKAIPTIKNGIVSKLFNAVDTEDLAELNAETLKSKYKQMLAIANKIGITTWGIAGKHWRKETYVLKKEFEGKNGVYIYPPVKKNEVGKEHKVKYTNAEMQKDKKELSEGEFSAKYKGVGESRYQADLDVYMGNFNELKKAYAMRLRALVHSKGDMTKTQVATIDTALVRKTFDQEGIPCMLGEGFIGRVDEEGRPYTVGGKPIASGDSGVQYGMLTNRVSMNPGYTDSKDEYVFRDFLGNAKPARDGGMHAGFNGTNMYTIEHWKGAAVKKDEVIDAALTNIKGYRKKWMSILKNEKFGINKVMAMVAELCYQTAQRIGSDTKGNTMGLTTLRMNNVKIKNTSIKFDYVGKHDIEQSPVYTINPGSANIGFYTAADGKLVYETMLKLMEGRDTNSTKDFAFELSGRRITSTDTLAFLRQHCGVGNGFHNHTFRHLKASVLVQNFLNEVELPFDKASNKKEIEAVKEKIKEAATIAGAALGHKNNKGDVNFATTIKSYIKPGIIANFMSKYNVPLSELPAVQDAMSKRNKTESSARNVAVASEISGCFVQPLFRTIKISIRR